ncbi:DUF6328 family protein [Arthrobacter sp. B6]|uniref:DUF6328 family protein n=1 Tax=Arthrobacter sp. B6 TaxID=1570137 RepID=UPI00082AF561|nr:DUF6328 family protein [Arthrobacter sp. B6]
MTDDEDSEVAARQLDELSSELRTIIPGVTVLFAFLLTVPFSSRFVGMPEQDRIVYMVSLMSAGGSLVLLLGESAYHRLRGKPYDKKLLIRTATRQAITALALLLVSLTSSIWYVTQVVFPGDLAMATAGGLLALGLVTWLFLPLARRLHGR